MNKYQEALASTRFTEEKDYILIKELVDLCTPMKVTNKKYPFNDMNGICPKCGERIDSECNPKHHLEDYCLQALDWDE